MKKVLLVVSTLDTGGAQKMTAEMSMFLSERYSVDILLNDDKSVSYPHKGKIISLGFNRTIERMNLLYQLRVLVRRIKYIKKHGAEYCAVISVMDSSNYANIIGNARNSNKTICSVRCVLSEKESWKYKHIVLPLDRALYGKADLVVTISKGVAEDLIHNVRYKHNNIRTIYNGLDLAQIRKRSEEPLTDEQKALLEGGRIIVTMGRLCEEKGQWHLIRAMKRIVESNHDVKLLILGEGDYRQYLEELINQAKLNNNVFLVGYEANPYKILAKASLFVFPSLSEGFGNVLVEAMALGIPCISSDYKTAAREILAPELSLDQELKEEIYLGSYGVIVPCPDWKKYDAFEPETREEASLGNAISMLLEDSELRRQYSLNAREGAKRFDAKNAAKQWIEAIEGL